MQDSTHKQSVISITLLNQHINIDRLRALVRALKAHFTYFEILLINPIGAKSYAPPPPLEKRHLKTYLTHLCCKTLL